MSASIHDTTWRPRGSVWLVAGAATLAPFMEILDTTIVNSQTIVVLRNGRIEHIGPPEDVYERPATPFVSWFVGKANFIPCTVERTIAVHRVWTQLEDWNDQRFVSWRDDFGSESYWAVKLGERVAARGADELWPLVASR